MPRFPVPVLALTLLLSAACDAGSPEDAASPTELTPAAAIEAEDADRERKAEAIRALEADVAASPDDPDARRLLGRALNEYGRFEDAVVQLERVVELRRDVRGLLELGVAYRAAARIPEAEQSYKEILKLAPGHPIALNNLASIAFNSYGQTQKALELYRQALKSDPAYLQAYFRLASTLELDGQYQEAYRTYGKVLALEPRSASELEDYDNAIYRLASLDIKMGELERALELLSVLLEGNPEHPKGHYALGQALLQLGRTEEAEREFDIHNRLLEHRKLTTPAASGM